jgi:hypothetical protein
VKQLADTVRTTGGTFMILWHNETLSEEWQWKGWRTVFETITEYALDDKQRIKAKKYSV